MQKTSTNSTTLVLLAGLSAVALTAALNAPAAAQEVSKPAVSKPAGPTAATTPSATAPAAPAASTPQTSGTAPAAARPQDAASTATHSAATHSATAPGAGKPQTSAAPAAAKPQGASAPKPRTASTGTTTGSTIKREPIKEPVSSIGCKRALQPGKPYFIEFRSRTAASYGHTFVFFGQLGGGNRFASFKVAGLHPKGEDPSTYIQGHWMPVDAETGVSYGDLDEQYLTARFCITLNQAEYNKAVAYIRHLQATQKTWHAPTYNCNSFASDIAKAIGLDSPNPNAYLPEAFIKRMADLNGNFNSGKKKDASSFSFPSFSSLQGSDKPKR